MGDNCPSRCKLKQELSTGDRRWWESRSRCSKPNLARSTGTRGRTDVIAAGSGFEAGRLVCSREEWTQNPLHESCDHVWQRSSGM